VVIDLYASIFFQFHSHLLVLMFSNMSAPVSFSLRGIRSRLFQVFEQTPQVDLKTFLISLLNQVP